MDNIDHKIGRLYFLMISVVSVSCHFELNAYGEYLLAYFFREIATFSLMKEDLEEFKQLRIVVRIGSGIGSGIDNIDDKEIRLFL